MNNVDWYGPGTFSWNPLAMRCSPVAVGCENCWHLRMANRLAQVEYLAPVVRDAYAGRCPAVLLADRPGEPARRRKPALIAVQFMGDLFHPQVSDDQRGQVWDAMRQTSRHIFLVLTKRPAAMRDYVQRHQPIPAGHIWPGLSLAEGTGAVALVDELAATPAVRRWVSFEPLVGEIHLPGLSWAALDWAVLGCESGPGRRPCKRAWLEGLLAQAAGAAVPCYVKQVDTGPAVVGDAERMHPQLCERHQPWEILPGGGG